MRNSVLGFNQEDAIELGLTTDDLLILDYIIRANGTPCMCHIVSDEVSYVWLSHQKIHEDLPILNITEGTLKNKLSRLKDLGLIQSKQTADGPGRGSRTFYSVTMSCIGMTTSRQNDVVSRPRHAKMTSDNSINTLNSNTDISSKEDIYSSDGVCSEFESKVYTEEDEFLGSAKRRKKPVSKKTNNLYQKCIDEIGKYTGGKFNEVSVALETYLKLRLSMHDKPIYGVGQWIGILKRLDEILQSPSQNAVDVINQSIQRGWATFFPVPNKARQKEVFSEYGEVTCEKSDGKESSGIEY